VVRFDTVRGQPNDLDIALREIGLTERDFRKFGSAHRSEVIGVRKKDGLALEIDFGERRVYLKNEIYPSQYPGATDPLMELDRPFGGFGLKVRCSASQTESWHSFQSTLIRTEMGR
jgi:hypothetical protein